MTISTERLQEMLAAAEKATPGPWDVWAVITRSKDEAVNELAYQVSSVPDQDFAGAVYLLNANGKCPATTGCGPTSAGNAAHIANCAPDTIRDLITELLASRSAGAEWREAVEALKPFAALGQYLIDEDLQTKPDDRPIWGFDRHELTYGDFCRAARALKENSNAA
jgi:hypothetical protein